MKLMHWSLVLPALLQIAASAPSNDTHKTYIVVLHPNKTADDLQSHLNWVKEQHDNSLSGKDKRDGNGPKGVVKEYRSDVIDFQGYAAHVKQSVAEEISKHPHVFIVEEDRDIAIPRVRREADNGSSETDGDGSVPNKNKNKSYGRWTVGQGFSTLTQKPLIVDAVIWPEKTKRDGQNTTVPSGTGIAEFNFTAPAMSAEVIATLNATEYFVVDTPETIKQEVEAEMRQMREEKARTQKRRVTSKRAAATETCQGSLDKRHFFTENYNSYLKALDVSGAAAISGWGQSASVSGNYLDQAKMSSNSLTFVIVIEVDRQRETAPGYEIHKARYKPGHFLRDFGNQWISGIKSGGKMIARVTFTSSDYSTANKIKAHAEASVGFWKVKGKFSASVQKSMDEVNKHSTVSVSFHYQGDLGVFVEQSTTPRETSHGSVQAAISEIQEQAAKFERHVCKHDFAYMPSLEAYEVVPGFQDLEDKPQAEGGIEHVYDAAHLYARRLLPMVVRVAEYQKWAEAIQDVLEAGPSQVHGSTDDAYTMQDEAIAIILKARKWVQSSEEQPQKAGEEALKLIKTIRNFFTNQESTLVQWKEVVQKGWATQRFP